MMFRSRVALRNIIFTVTFDILIRTDSSFHDDIHNNQKYSWNHSFIIRTTLCVLLRRIMMRSGAPHWSYSTACSCQTAGATWTPQRSRLVFYCSECLNNMSWSVSSIKANATIHDFGNSKHLVVCCFSVSFTWIWMFFWYSVTHEASVKARRTSGWKQDKQTWRTWTEQRNSGPARTTQTARTIKRSHTWKWFECERSDDDQITVLGSCCRSEIKHWIREKTRRLEGTQQLLQLLQLLSRTLQLCSPQRLNVYQLNSR